MEITSGINRSHLSRAQSNPSYLYSVCSPNPAPTPSSSRASQLTRVKSDCRIRARVSKEEDVEEQHNIVADGYNVGRDLLVVGAVGEHTGFDGTKFKFNTYETIVTNLTGLLAPGADGINHGGYTIPFINAILIFFQRDCTGRGDQDADGHAEVKLMLIYHGPGRLFSFKLSPTLLICLYF